MLSINLRRNLTLPFPKNVHLGSSRTLLRLPYLCVCVCVCVILKYGHLGPFNCVFCTFVFGQDAEDIYDKRGRTPKHMLIPQDRV